MDTPADKQARAFEMIIQTMRAMLAAACEAATNNIIQRFEIKGTGNRESQITLVDDLGGEHVWMLRPVPEDVMDFAEAITVVMTAVDERHEARNNGGRT